MHRALELALEDDSDDDFAIRRPRWTREREDHFENLDEEDFVKRFRLSKRSVMTVLESIEEHLEFRTDKNNSVSPMNQLLCALRYYATGCHQVAAGDFSGVSQPTAHRIIHRMSCALAALRPNVVVFPETPEEIRKTQVDFYKIAKFPRVLGAIDCTHIRFAKSPDGENGEIFRNRKNYFSLNVQAICNADLEMTDIVVRWPGSTHDSFIFNNCSRKVRFENGFYKDAVLLGDSGYSCKKYLMTPLEVCRTAAENLYNESQIRSRNPIERMFGVWKRRFPSIAIGLNVSLENSFPIIMATAILHNVAQKAREELPPDDVELTLPAPWDVILAEGNIPPENQIAERPRRENIHFVARRTLVETHFQSDKISYLLQVLAINGKLVSAFSTNCRNL